MRSEGANDKIVSTSNARTGVDKEAVSSLIDMFSPLILLSVVPDTLLSLPSSKEVILSGSIEAA